MDFFARPGRCGGILLLLSLVYFTPLALHPTELIYSEHSDILVQHYPWQMFAATQFHERRELPLWTPNINAGQPFQADPQSNLFYPPHWLFYTVPTAGVAPLMGCMVWLHVLLAGLGMHAYARGRGLAPFPALVSAVGFMFGGKWLTHLLAAGHYVFLPLAWLPLLLLAVETSLRTRRLTPAVAGGVIGGVMVLGSHPQLLLYLAYLAPIISLEAFWPTAADSGKVVSKLGRWVLTWSVVGVATLGLSAVQWLPSVELVRQTTRARLIDSSYGAGYEWTIQSAPDLPMQMLALAGPQFWTGTAWEGVGAWGVLWTAVAILAVCLCRGPDVRLHASVLLFMVLFTLGAQTPLYPVLRSVLPGLSLMRIPSRILLFSGLSLAVLAGRLTAWLLSEEATPLQFRRAAGLMVGVTAFALALTYKGGLPANPYWLLLMLVGPGLAAVLWLRGLHQTTSPRLAAAWLLLLVADLWGQHWQLLQTRPVDQIYPDNDAVRFLAAHPGSYRILDEPFKPGPQYATCTPVTQALCYLRQLHGLRAMNVTNLYEYRQFLQYVSGIDKPPPIDDLMVLGPIAHPQLLDLLAVRYRFRPADSPLPPTEERGWRFVERLTDTHIHEEVGYLPGGFVDVGPFDVYERTTPTPRVLLVSEVEPLPPPAERLPTLLGVDVRRVAFLDNPTAPGAPLPALSGDAEVGTAEIVIDEPDRVVVEADLTRPGCLVLLDVWYPGWQCRTAEGRELPVWRADGLFRAVELPAGRQRVEFVFRPTMLRIGASVSLASLAGVGIMAGWMWWSWRQRRAKVAADSGV
jgi:hypothetical protein